MKLLWDLGREFLVLAAAGQKLDSGYMDIWIYDIWTISKQWIRCLRPRMTMTKVSRRPIMPLLTVYWYPHFGHFMGLWSPLFLPLSDIEFYNGAACDAFPTIIGEQPIASTFHAKRVIWPSK